MRQLAENLWVQSYPLRLLGLPIGRNVTVLRLTSGALVIHSTAPFTFDDVQQITALGEPRWLLDCTRFHDSYARPGRAAFPDAIYLAPEAFPRRAELNAAPLLPAHAEWEGEIEVLRLEGMPQVQEHAILHVPTRTLIVGDLLFRFGADASALTKFILRYLMRLPKLSGMSLAFRFMIRDRAAFLHSIARLLEWDFDRVIVGHGEVLEKGGKTQLKEVLAANGFILRHDVSSTHG